MNLPNTVCDEILKHLQQSLCKCVSNTKMHEYNNLDKMLKIKDCTNITNYLNTLQTTKTKITIIPNVIEPDTKYIMKYDVHARHLVMDEFVNYFALE